MVAPAERQSQPGTATAEGAERRRSPRQAYSAGAWVSPEAGVRGKDHQVSVFDLSLHGVGFTSKESFRPDAVHWMVLGVSGLRASSRIRIVNCRPNNEGGYDCGAEFF
jgi:PilZ domain-containing protein